MTRHQVFKRFARVRTNSNPTRQPILLASWDAVSVAASVGQRQHPFKETLNKSFDELRTNAKLLIPFVVSLSNQEWNQLIQCFLKNFSPNRSEPWSPAGEGEQIQAGARGLRLRGVQPESARRAALRSNSFSISRARVTANVSVFSIETARR